MAEVFEQGVASSARSEHASGAANAAVEAAHHYQRAELAQRRAGSAIWSSTLDAKDLACLMAVIEQQLLPNLLRSYRPPEQTLPISSRQA